MEKVTGNKVSVLYIDFGNVRSLLHLFYLFIFIWRHYPGFPLSGQKKKSPTFLDKIAGNVSNKCTFINPNYPSTSHMKNELQYEWNTEINFIKLSCHNQISLTTQIPRLFPDLRRILWHFQVSRNSSGNPDYCSGWPPTIRQFGFDLPWQLVSAESIPHRAIWRLQKEMASRRLIGSVLLWQRPKRCLTLSTHALSLTEPDGGLFRLHSADDDAVQWLAKLGRWTGLGDHCSTLWQWFSLKCKGLMNANPTADSTESTVVEEWSQSSRCHYP